jgi:DNA-binding response OmpR family regulator
LKKILIVDDEADIRQLLKDALELEGYETITAENGMEVFAALGSLPDLILLDINLPDMDGYQVCRAIRDYVSAPILFLTARADEADRVQGLRLGGDDYIVKPFGMEELLARVEAHFRREERMTRQPGQRDDNTKTGEAGFSGHARDRQPAAGRESAKHSAPAAGCEPAVSGLIIDFPGCRILRDGRDIGLTRTEYRIAELLYVNRGKVFGREQIYERVRGYDGTGDAGIVTEHIRRIRKKLGETDGKQWIETVWGVGYRWIG